MAGVAHPPNEFVVVDGLILGQSWLKIAQHSPKSSPARESLLPESGEELYEVTKVSP